MSANPEKKYKTLRTSFHSDIFEIALNRPNRYNAVNFLMIQELHDVLDMLSTFSHSKIDPFVENSKGFPRVVFLTGLGEAFSVGVDLREADSNPEWDFGGLHSQQLMSKVIEKLYYLPQVVISLIHGPAVGLGFALALASDIRIGSVGCSFSVGFTALGLSGTDMGVSYMLPKIVGVSKATEMMLTCSTIRAKEAKELHLLHHLAESKEGVQKKGEAIAGKILAGSPWGIFITKQQVKASLDGTTLRQALIAENSHQTYLLSRDEVMKLARTRLSQISSKL